MSQAQQIQSLDANAQEIKAAMDALLTVEKEDKYGNVYMDVANRNKAKYERLRSQLERTLSSLDTLYSI